MRIKVEKTSDSRVYLELTALHGSTTGLSLTIKQALKVANALVSATECSAFSINFEEPEKQ